MARWSGKGLNKYEEILSISRYSGGVGVHLHMRNPTDSLSRIGFSGRRIKKKDLVELTARLSQQSKNRPGLALAAKNLQSLSGYKPLVVNIPKPELKPTPVAKVVPVVKVAPVIKELVVSLPVVHSIIQPKPTISEEEAREMWRKEKLKKIAESLKSVHYGKVFLKTRNAPG